MSAWRERCPQGHASLETSSDGYYCQPCDRHYAGDPVDARQVDEWPVASVGHRDSLHPYEVLWAIVEQCQRPTRSRVKMSHLDIGTMGQRSHAVADLREQGFITAVEAVRGNWWAPTDKGRRMASLPAEGDA